MLKWALSALQIKVMAMKLHTGKSIYYAFLLDSRSVLVMLPKKRGEGFLKSPCARTAGRDDSLVKLVDNILDPIMFVGEAWVLSLSYLNPQNTESIQPRLEQLASMYYNEKCLVKELSLDQLSNKANNAKKTNNNH